jgi:hypothetical protein
MVFISSIVYQNMNYKMKYALHKAVNFFLAFKSQFAPKCKRWHHGIGTLNGGKSPKKTKKVIV